MITNPLLIPPGTIFLLGSTKTDVQNFQAYDVAEKELIDRDLKCINPCIVFSEDKPEEYTPEMAVNVLVAFLSQCDKVLTLPGWEDTAEGQALMNVARALNKDMVLFDRFLKSFDQKKNADSSVN